MPQKVLWWLEITLTQNNQMLCVILHHLYDLKNVTKTHGGVILLVKLSVFHVFKIVQMVLNHGKHH